MASNSNLLALDVGTKRIGVAIARAGLNIAQPLETLDNNGSVFSDIAKLSKEEDIHAVVVGLPRNLEGEETAQTRYAKDFAKKLAEEIEVKIYFQDEALTSVMAEQQLELSKKAYAKGDVDALAATMILSDFLDNQEKVAS